MSNSTAQPDPKHADPTAERADRMKRLSIIPIWNTSGVAEEMGYKARGHVWRWRDLHAEFEEAVKTSLAGPGTERRILLFENPGMPRSAAATPTLNGALQMILPGEVAPAHRHTYSALRFILSGSGAFTVVDGTRADMHELDLLLTPGGCWHSHAHNGGTEPMVWFDALDTPFVSYMRADCFEMHPSKSLEPYTNTVGSYEDIGALGMLQGRTRAQPPASPQLVYKWAAAEAMIQAGLDRDDDDPYEGVVYEYVNPITGGHVMPTIACHVNGFRKGFHSKARRRTSSSLCVVAKGSGATIIDGVKHEWSERDVIAEPAWSWCEYIAYEKSILFRTSDQPILEPFGLARQEDHPNGRQ
ncbi:MULTISPECIES: cupin domain-containing protein [Bradyrhizobium]|uniref:Cupin n=3 Tax=Bradyrhizobium TaxID=374 RepID=A0AAE6CCJ4_9BRAD|nr:MULTISPECIES: cupin domain-containing protein [Bradyrhizobium]MCG2628250.1 cupin domain-containing protein [Bradyrhizobium zhengyangense]MCG2643369.1 cupin domain-containing protein [Bradyrhizobium zhengyangense]MCG2670317.1 cupin domain-containing protein [Bradyrhizobium zhengyangense]MDN4985949.1 cupin domain-containing protein [Bradyrhizobium sp. WYCCWR 13022]MDN5002671.1 cupin domain-containing protein [Bradyrhizobium sp. WYCCWR 12677]